MIKSFFLKKTEQEIELPLVGMRYKHSEIGDPSDDRGEEFEVVAIYKGRVVGYKSGRNYTPNQTLDGYEYLDDVPIYDFFKYFEPKPL